MERRSGFQIMKRLIKELNPLKKIMMITISLGVLGFLAAISIATFSAVSVGIIIGDISYLSLKASIAIIIISAILRGFLRYGEQLSGHYIAFKILYILRDKIFTKLRQLGPAKLEGKERGNLISIITSDIELLEVFYAHTIAPISIAIITNTIIVIMLSFIHPVFGLLAAIFYIIVGFFIPYLSSSVAKKDGVEYRNVLSECNNYILDSLRGLKEIVLFNEGKSRLKNIEEKSKQINKNFEGIKRHEGIIRALTDLTIMLAILSFIFIGSKFYMSNIISFSQMIIAAVVIASSFGPVVALSNLSNTLLQTFACAERIFNLLDEEPKVSEVFDGNEINGELINYKNVSFSYDKRKEAIFDTVSIDINQGDKIALIGESGIGKSTFIKLMMRFWDVDKGKITLDNYDIKDVNTKSIRDEQTLVSQETYLFNESIIDNIRIGNLNATFEEVVEAAKKASIHEFIGKLPNGYETKVGELGSSISSGEKQRIGLARAFLKDSKILILDEPTSNLDTLNEASILKPIKDNCKEKTIVLISHRKSTTAICKKVLKLENKKIIEC